MVGNLHAWGRVIAAWRSFAKGLGHGGLAARAWRLIADAALNRSGAIAIIFGLVAPTALGLIGLGVETGLWFQTQHELQTAADAAALAGALELHNGNKATYVAIAKMESQRNSVQDGVNNQTVTINSPPLAPDPNAGNATAVQAITTRKQNLFFSALFLTGGSMTITSSAVAAVHGPGVCLLALNPSQNNAMQFNGAATQTLTNCAVMSDSTSTQGFTASGSATVNSNLGFYTAASAFNISSSGMTGPQTANAAPVADPYASLVGSFPPLLGMALYPLLDCNPFVNTTFNSNGTLNPGTYGGIDVTSQATLTLNPGTYYLDANPLCLSPGGLGGALKIQGGGTISGAGVTIVLTNSTLGSFVNVGQVTISGNSTANLSAPAAGPLTAAVPYPGFLFVNDTRPDKAGDGYSAGGNPCGNCKEAFSGGASMTLTGALYFPNDEVDMTGNNAASGCITMVADVLNFTGANSLTDNCSNQAGTPGLPTVAGSIQLLE
jgi:Flp pilus assembly protein TadG